MMILLESLIDLCVENSNFLDMFEHITDKKLQAEIYDLYMVKNRRARNKELGEYDYPSQYLEYRDGDYYC